MEDLQRYDWYDPTTNKQQFYINDLHFTDVRSGIIQLITKYCNMYHHDYIVISNDSQFEKLVEFIKKTLDIYVKFDYIINYESLEKEWKITISFPKIDNWDDLLSIDFFILKKEI